jgi:hypothetical protein
MASHPQAARATGPSTISTADLESCSGLPRWQFDAIVAATAATKDKQINLDRSASFLLILWCFLGDSPVSIEAIQRIGKTQPRWTADGELGVLRPEQVGINDLMVDVSTNTNQLDAAVQTLFSSGLLNHATPLCDNSSTYTVDVDMKKQIVNSISPEARVLWTNQVLILVAFIFPRPNISQE